ncbi:hypothetical protein BC826DRAFT_1107919 [Russula brevipes]|nr:hypothetical protein BC826DRAFT_1107919 [Russula brevipes]
MHPAHPNTAHSAPQRPPVARYMPPPPPLPPPHAPPHVPWNPVTMGGHQNYIPGAPMYAPWMHGQPHGMPVPYPPAAPPYPPAAPPYPPAAPPYLPAVPPYPPAVPPYPLAAPGYPPFPHLQQVPAAPQFQPWGYIHRPMGHSPDIPNPPASTQERTEAGAVDAAHTAAAPARTMNNTKKNYPNKQIGENVWQFMVEVTDDHTRNTFEAHTDMVWREFIEEAHGHINKPREDVRFGYRVRGESRPMSYLTCESEWKVALDHMKERVLAARTRAVCMELKNMHESAKKASYTKKGKGKRTRNEDVPQPPLPETQRQFDCLLELQRHLLCQTHSKDGLQVYCWIKPATKDSSGGHVEMDHEKMTLWAKYISYGKATKTLPPNSMTFAQPVKKKPKTSYPTPEVHIALNITPAQGVDGTTHGPYIVSAPIAQPQLTSTPALARRPAAEVSNTAKTVPCSTTEHVPMTQQQPSGPTGMSRINLLMDAITSSSRPSILEVLRLMDAKEPMPGKRYADAHTELYDNGITDILDVYTYPVELLAPLGNLGKGGIHRLRRFTWERVLRPLTYVLVGPGDDDSVVEVAKEAPFMRDDLRERGGNHEGDSESIGTERIRRQEAIQEWIDSNTQQGEDMYAVDCIGSTVDVSEREYDAASSSSSQEV